jgi:hypothetical protein
VLFIFETELATVGGNTEPALKPMVYTLGKGGFIYSADRKAVLCVFIVDEDKANAFRDFAGAQDYITEADVNTSRFHGFASTLAGLQAPPDTTPPVMP